MKKKKEVKERLVVAKLSNDLWKKLRILAIEREITLKSAVSEAILDYLKKHGS